MLGHFMCKIDIVGYFCGDVLADFRCGWHVEEITTSSQDGPSERDRQSRVCTSNIRIKLDINTCNMACKRQSPRGPSKTPSHRQNATAPGFPMFSRTIPLEGSYELTSEIKRDPVLSDRDGGSCFMCEQIGLSGESPMVCRLWHRHSWRSAIQAERPQTLASEWPNKWTLDRQTGCGS